MDEENTENKEGSCAESGCDNEATTYDSSNTGFCILHAPVEKD